MSILETKTIFTGRVVRLAQEKVCLPDKSVVDFEIVYHRGGSAIVAINDKREVCLLRQYRHAVRDWVWEIPAGMLDVEDDSTLQRAKIELQEETGCTATKWTELGYIQSSPGVFTEKVHLFLAVDLKFGEQQLEHGEVLEVHWLDFQTALQQVQNGKINDAKTCIALFRAAKYL